MYFSSLCDFLKTYYFCNSLVAEGSLGELEPKGIAKSQGRFLGGGAEMASEPTQKERRESRRACLLYWDTAHAHRENVLLSGYSSYSATSWWWQLLLCPTRSLRAGQCKCLTHNNFTPSLKTSFFLNYFSYDCLYPFSFLSSAPINNFFFFFFFRDRVSLWFWSLSWN